jgi:DNA-binding NarL/FixJ family response regulator
LSQGQAFEVTGDEPAEADLLRRIEEDRTQVVLIDLSLPHELAVHLTEEIHQRFEAVKIVLLTREGCHDHLVECIEAGAHGCILEEASLDELRAAIERVLRGEMFCSPEIAHSMFQRLAEAAHESRWQERSQSAALTSRELEVLHLVADRLANKEIAKRLSLSLHTVKNHVHNIVEKLCVEDRFEAVEYARKQRWLRRSYPRDHAAGN